MKQIGDFEIALYKEKIPSKEAVLFLGMSDRGLFLTGTSFILQNGEVGGYSPARVEQVKHIITTTKYSGEIIEYSTLLKPPDPNNKTPQP